LLAAHYRRVAPSFCGRPVHVWLRRDDDRAVRARPRVCPPFPPARAPRRSGAGPVSAPRGDAALTGSL
jgi:hypothetical protein